jgi:tetrahydromethanopterin S-methyltransferase subunit B
MGDSRPRPDPTVRTEEQLRRELDLNKEWILAKLEDIYNRFESGDKAVQLLQEFANRQPTTATVALKVDSLKDLLVTVLAERNTARAAENQASATAILKSEQSLTKVIEALAELVETKTGGLNEKISAVETRTTVIESRANGSTAYRQETRAQTSNTGVVVGMILGGLGALISVVAVILSRMPS